MWGLREGLRNQSLVPGATLLSCVLMQGHG